MATNLAHTAYWARLFIKYGTVLVLLLVFSRVLWGVGVSIYHRISPPAPPAPTVSYGKLPGIAFPQPSPSKKFSFTLELPESELPKVPATLPVYVIPKKSAFLGAPDEARKTAALLRFIKDEEILSSTVYRWAHERGDIKLEMNIITQAFSINSNLYQDSAVSALRAPSQEIAVKVVQSFLSSANLFPKDFADGKTSTTLVKNENGILALAPSLSEANFTRVDFFRQNYNDFPVVAPVPGQSNVWFLVSGTTDPARSIIAGEYHYFAVDESQSSTYPIKTSETAWQELQDGKGIVASPPAGGPAKETIAVRRVYLAYYDPSDYQPFFQPVYVFEGDEGFVGYVPAVTTDYYTQVQTTP